jgi:SAM-dependent methyltransferase
MTTLLRRLRRSIRRRIWLPGAGRSLEDLVDLDRRYGRMHADHAPVHARAVEEIARDGNDDVLEVACGTGWNAPSFARAGLSYVGLDISETAVAVAVLKHPDHPFLNLGIQDAGILRDGCFDAVYSSAMLEHLGDPHGATRQMLRLARRTLVLLFFEGLSDDDEHRVEFHEHVGTDGATWRPSRTDPSRVERNVFGRKLILQSHGTQPERGWYWNRYSRRRILELFEGRARDVTVLGSAERDGFGAETLLVVRK